MALRRAHPRPAYLSTFALLETLPHDPLAFTQGLCIDDDGVLWESVGNYGESAILRHEVSPRREAAATSSAQPSVESARGGAAIEALQLPSELFAEGLACMPGGVLLALTWRESVVIEASTSPTLSLARLRPLEGEFAMDAPASEGAPARPREMWGLAFSPRTGELVASNGSSQLLFLHPQSLAIVRTVRVRDAVLGLWVSGLNELEFVERELWANVYPMYQHSASRCVVRIDPTDGSVLGWVDLNGLAELQPDRVRALPMHWVLNGIAYNHSRAGAAPPPPRPTAFAALRRRAAPSELGEIYVTGKRWDALYRIGLRPMRTSGAAPLVGGETEADEKAKHEDAEHIRRECGLYLGRRRG